jgi:hypothetical protein
VGFQNWTTGTTDSRYQELNMTDNFSVFITGDFIIQFQLPNGTKHIRQSNVTIRSNVTDYCDVMVNETEFHYTVTNETGRDYSCIDKYDEGDGWYNCSFNTSAMSPRGYNTTMNVSKYMYNNYTFTVPLVNNVSSFWIETYPVFQEPTAIPTTGGWSETFYFTVNVTDEDLDYTYVELYYYDWDGTHTWTLFDTDNQSGINWTVNESIIWGTGFVDHNLSIKFNTSEDDDWVCAYDPNVCESDEINKPMPTTDKVKTNRAPHSIQKEPV